MDLRQSRLVADPARVRITPPSSATRRPSRAARRRTGVRETGIQAEDDHGR